VNLCAFFVFLFGLLLLAPEPLAQVEVGDSLAALRHTWAHIKYQLPETQRETAYARLHARARRIRTAHPDYASLWIWEAIILANEAGEKHSLASIQMIKKAKLLLEKAISIHPNADAGLAYGFLGNLYHSMPGWPIGFGDERKAEYYLKKALAIEPNGLDENYFAGIYMRDGKRFAEAVFYFRHALHAPPRPGMDVADAGRKADAARLLNQAMEKMRR